ncbi:MAG: 3-dehydroquinate dehydratase / shikimate dehydrogenase [Acidobacteriota bacterium]|nr:3-dehydroquinate dehydratase / shikimate dehydrogenase [Acidobacteriota bacterium]
MTPINNSRARICVPICVRRADDLAAAIECAAQLADLIELRLDCLEDDAQLDAVILQLPAILREHARPFIFTFRPAEQGGHRALDAATRMDFWTRRLHPILEESTKRTDADRNSAPRHFVDLELDLFDGPRWRDALASLSKLVTLIVSQHDFAGIPVDLESIYERAANVHGAIPKLAVRAADITDCLPVLRLLERARREGRDVIAVAMGEAGLLTRVLGPSRGALLTYGSLDLLHATAPGQSSARDLRELYRIDSISERTSITGLVGWPVAHSLSPQMHNAAFAARGIDGVYIPFETRDVRAFARRMAHPRTRELEWNLRGFSVTAPHKSAIIEELDEIDAAAREIGAVNTVVCVGDALCGYNTDADASLAPLRGLIDLKGARVALVGAGGAARAVLWRLRESNARTAIFARDNEQARAVAELFGASLCQLEGASFDGFDLVINATPLGTRGAHEGETVATAEQLQGARIAYDLVYNPAETRFLREARAAGCEAVVGGLAMLIAQAAAQFELWTGTTAPPEVMRAAAERKLSSE